MVLVFFEVVYLIFLLFYFYSTHVLLSSSVSGVGLRHCNMYGQTSTILRFHGLIKATKAMFFLLQETIAYASFLNFFHMQDLILLWEWTFVWEGNVYAHVTFCHSLETAKYKLNKQADMAQSYLIFDWMSYQGNVLFLSNTSWVISINRLFNNGPLIL